MAKTILVVEDDQFLSKILKMKFEKIGYEILVAYDGLEALEMAKTKSPDLALLDIMMPVKDGFSVLAEMKKDSKLSKIPVIIASNLGQKEDKDKAVALGAEDYIVKSDTSLDDLVKRTREILGDKQITCD